MRLDRPRLSKFFCEILSPNLEAFNEQLVVQRTQQDIMVNEHRITKRHPVFDSFFIN